MLRKLAVLAILVMVLAAAYGAAASLGLNGGAIQYGIDADLRCDVNGVQVDGWGLETDDNTVRYVRITGIATECVNNEMFVKVFDSSNNLLGYAHHNVAGGTETFNFTTPYPDAGALSLLKVWIEGSAAP